MTAIFQYGTCIKGAFYDDRAAIRDQDLEKIKANKLILTKTKLEFVAVRPGSLTVDGKDASVKVDEDRITLLRVVTIEKVKGI